MWKCRQCGSTKFEAVFHHTMEIGITKDGDYKELGEEESYIDTCRCKQCDNEFFSIDEIADWIEGSESI